MDKTTLDVRDVNQDFIPFDGRVIITVNLHGNEDPTLSIYVPFLVSVASRYATIGFNTNVHPWWHRPACKNNCTSERLNNSCWWCDLGRMSHYSETHSSHWCLNQRKVVCNDSSRNDVNSKWKISPWNPCIWKITPSRTSCPGDLSSAAFSQSKKIWNWFNWWKMLWFRVSWCPKPGQLVQNKRW